MTNTSGRWAASLDVRAAAGLVAIVLFAITLGGCRSATTPPPASDHLSYNQLLQWTQENGVPGSVLLVQSPHETFLGAVGCADVAHHVPMSPDYELGPLKNPSSPEIR